MGHQGLRSPELHKKAVLTVLSITLRQGESLLLAETLTKLPFYLFLYPPPRLCDLFIDFRERIRGNVRERERERERGINMRETLIHPYVLGPRLELASFWCTG